MTPFDHTPRTRLVYGENSLAQLGRLARELGFRRTLLVADPGILAAGHVARAAEFLRTEGIDTLPFDNFNANPDSHMIETGRIAASAHSADSIIGLGGGSSMDCAKGINFVFTNGGTMKDYCGYAKTTRPMLPMIGIPATTGTGSEAQSYALISDPETHVKMACGDPQAAFRIAILDPLLTVSQPPAVRATAGYDAISHAVESFVTTGRNVMSDCYARQAWLLLDANYERILARPDDVEALGAMQLGSYLAGAAIECSMLGATHACANPLTAHYGITHGVAIAALLEHVVRWNRQDRYREFHPDLPARLHHLALAGGVSKRLSQLNVTEEKLPALAADAAQQWTGRFNPRPFDAAGALEIYQCAY